MKQFKILKHPVKEINECYELLLDDVLHKNGTTLFRLCSKKNFTTRNCSISVKRRELGGYVSIGTVIENYSWVDENSEVYGTSFILENSLVEFSTINNAQIIDSLIRKTNIDSNSNIRIEQCLISHVKLSNSKYCYPVIINSIIYYDSTINKSGKGVCLIESDMNDKQVFIPPNYIAEYKSKKDMIVCKGIGPVGRMTSCCRLNNGNVSVTCGCFKGTIDEFEYRVRSTYGNKNSEEYQPIYANEYYTLIDLIKAHFKCNSLKNRIKRTIHYILFKN